LGDFEAENERMKSDFENLMNDIDSIVPKSNNNISAKKNNSTTEKLIDDFYKDKISEEELIQRVMTPKEKERPLYSHPEISKYPFSIHEQQTCIEGKFVTVQTRSYDDGPVESVVATPELCSNLFFRRGLISQITIDVNNRVTKYVELKDIQNYSFNKITNLYKILQNDIIDAQFSYKQHRYGAVHGFELVVEGQLKFECEKFYRWRIRVDKDKLKEAEKIK